MDQEISSSPHPSGSAAPASCGGDRDRDKNEAEPKTNNVLLKVGEAGSVVWVGAVECVCVWGGGGGGRREEGCLGVFVGM